MPIQNYKRQSHPYHDYHHRRHTPKTRAKWPWFLLLVPLIAIAVIATSLLVRPLPLITPEQQVVALASTKTPVITWPKKSQAAFGTLSQGVLQTKSSQQARPTASTIKLLTVLTILDKKPLQAGEQGPLIPITQADVAIYNRYFSQNGSLAEIKPGEKITEHQMIEGILIPSANNYADSLAVWAYGSLSNYQKAAQIITKKLNMTRTNVGVDASGFSPTSTSTAADLTKLGIAAIKNPIIAEIVAKKQIELPVAGIKQNTNWSLAQNGMIGIKTGNTDEAGGVFVFAAKSKVDVGREVTVVGVVQGEATVYDAIVSAQALIKQIQPQFEILTPIKKGQTLATYTTPWGAAASATAQSDISFVHWPGFTPPTKLSLKSIKTSFTRPAKVGTIRVGNQTSAVVIKKSLLPPPLKYRLFGLR